MMGQMLHCPTGQKIVAVTNNGTKVALLTGKKVLKKRSSLLFQELPSGESTTTECGVNYQLLAVIY